MTIFKCAIRLHDMIHFMNLHVLDERNLFVAEPIDIFEGSRVIREQTLQCRLQQPATDLCLARDDVAEVRVEGWAERLPIDIGCDDVEVDQKPLFILDNFWLRGRYADVLREAFPGVL